MTARSWNQNVWHVPAIPYDVAKTLAELENELGPYGYERWVNAFIPDNTTWAQVKMLAAKTLEEKHASNDRRDISNLRYG